VLTYYTVARLAYSTTLTLIIILFIIYLSQGAWPIL